MDAHNLQRHHYANVETLLQPPESSGAFAVKLMTVGIDLANNVFQTLAVDERSNKILKKQLKRDQVGVSFANMSPYLIGMAVGTDRKLSPLVVLVNLWMVRKTLAVLDGRIRPKNGICGMNLD